MDKEQKTLMVTIRCITYNHEPYIRKCLEGFVMQQTNFKFEAVVHDDASTDGTAAIIAEFAEKYPDIIKPIYETENQYSKKDGSLQRIMNAHMRGKYIAMCEGDDYWTDPLKLQKQVDFLEANHEYSMCFHNVDVLCDVLCADINNDRLYNHLETKEYNIEEILLRWTVPTCSVVHRKEVLQKRPQNNKFKVGDNVLFAACTLCGKLYCINEKMATYRRLNSGLTTTLKPNIMIEHWDAFGESFPMYKDIAEKLSFRDHIGMLIKSLKNRNFIHTFYCTAKRFGGFKTSISLLKAVVKHFVNKL